MHKGTTEFYHCNMISSGLDCGWESQGQYWAKSVGFIFLHTFQLNGMKFGLVMKEFQLNILILLSNEIYVIKEDNRCFTDHIKKLMHCYALGLL